MKNHNIEFREIYYEILQKIFKFDVWHISPIEARPYALFLVKRINRLIKSNSYKNEIIEIGCGIGDIISEIDYPSNKKSGYDLDKNVVNAARFVHKNVKFYEGSFNLIRKKKISLLIAVNFLHAIDEEQVKTWFSGIIRENDINTIIVDEVERPAYMYSHNYIKIFEEEGYKLSERTRSFAAMGWSRRKFLIFTNRN